MDALKFESGEAIVEGISSRCTFEYARAKIPNGWIVVINKSSVFIPDPTHQWDGASLLSCVDNTRTDIETDAERILYSLSSLNATSKQISSSNNDWHHAAYAHLKSFASYAAPITYWLIFFATVEIINIWHHW